MKIDGFKETMASKLYSGVKNQLIKVKMSIIMNASNIFGRGFGDAKLYLINIYYFFSFIFETNNFFRYTSYLFQLILSFPSSLFIFFF